MTFLESVLTDVRFGFRMLLKNPPVTTAALMSLALGTGACIAAFSVLDALVLRPLPVREPHRLVQLTVGDRTAIESDTFSAPLFDRLRSASSGRVELFGVTYQGVRPVVFHNSGEQEEQVRAQWVSGNMFATLGVTAAIGRTLEPSDDTARVTEPVAVLSYPFWVRRFGADPGVLGTRFAFPGRDLQFQIVGVAEKGFTGIERGRLTEIWVPTATWSERASSMPWWDWIRVFGRMKAGVEPREIQSTLQTTFSSFRSERDFGADEPRKRVERFRAAPLRARSAASGPSFVQDQLEQPLWILMLVVTLVLVVAGSNVGNLFFARAVTRQHEMAIRLSVGASRARLVQQVLTETALIAAGAAYFGWLFASLAAPAIVRMLAVSGNAVYADLRNDWRLVAFIVVMVAVTTALFGLAPALRASSVAPMGVIKSGGSRVRSDARVLRPLAGLQVAFGLVVLFLTGLFVSSLAHLSAVDIGFRAQDLLVVTVENRATLDPQRERAASEQLLDGLGRTPRVERAALSNWAPFRAGEGNGLTIRMRVPGTAGVVEAEVQRVSPTFFDTAGVRLVDGRTFGPQDWQHSPIPIIVNATLARRLATAGRVVGQRPERIEEREILRQEIIGVVSDARTGDLRRPAPPIVYDLFSGLAPIQTLLVRTSGDPISLASDIRRQVPQIEPSLRVIDVVPQSKLVQDAFLRERVLALLSGFLAAVALLLAAVGLYGVLSYLVVQRTREIGIRLALGADPSVVSRWVLADIGRVIGTGVVAGLAGGLLLAPRLASLLFEVQPLDVWSIAAPVGSLLLAAVIATIPPARRAARIDPLVALRFE